MAGKWIAMTVSSCAALLSILSYARSYGMIGAPSSMQMAVGPLAAAWVGLSPPSVTATSIGDTVHLAATVTNRSGSVLVGSWLQWTSDDSSVATVDPTGTVIARAPGTTTIMVVVGKHLAKSRVTVRPEPHDVRFVPDSGVVIPEGGHQRVRPHVVDARGYVIRDLMPTLRIADTTVATADTSGLIIANAPGRTTLEAVAGGITARVDIRVNPVPSAIAGVSGTDQHASAGRPLPAPVLVRVQSLRGRPISGIPVHFTTADGQGLVDPATVITDSAGRARTNWTLGELPGRQRLFARTEQLDSALIVMAEADPVASNVRHTLLNDAQVANAGDTLPSRVGVRVTDSTGRAMVDIPVSWIPSDDDSIVPLAARTDSLGEAHVRWTLGTRTGVHRARVQIGATRAVPAYPVTAIARAGAPTIVTVRSGQAQKATAGSALGQPIVLHVADRHENPVAGATVTVTPEAGSVRDTVLATDSAGRAVIRWTLGPVARAQKLVVRISGVRKPVEITATASIGRAAKASFATAPTSPVAGKPLAPATVTITDATGNPIAGAAVVFKPSGGTVSAASAKTDAKGRASTTWTLGPNATSQILTASVAGTTAKATLEVIASSASKSRTPTKTPPKAPTTSKKPPRL